MRPCFQSLSVLLLLYGDSILQQASAVDHRAVGIQPTRRLRKSRRKSTNDENNASLEIDVAELKSKFIGPLATTLSLVRSYKSKSHKSSKTPKSVKCSKSKKSKSSKSSKSSYDCEDEVSPTQSPSVTTVPTVLTAPTASPTLECETRASRESAANSITQSVSGSIQPGSSQELALNWLINEDTSNACESLTEMTNRYALAVFYYSAGGENWYDNTNWLDPNTSICDWYGVRCDEDSIPTELRLSSNSMSGTLPEEISAINSMTTLQFFQNDLGSGIPLSIYSLPAIRAVDFEQNQFTGDLFPTEIFGASSTLKFYRAGNTNLTGTIPSSISQLSGLKQLWIAETDVAGPIPPEFTQLVDLTSFIAYNCSLTGSIPDNIGDLNMLEVFDVGFNQLTSSLPESLGSLTKIEKMYINNNLLNGKIPESMNALVDIQELLAEENDFEGALPSGFSSFQRLENITFADNNLDSQLPSFQSAFLTFVDFRNNGLTGTIPSTIFDSDKLSSLLLSGNKIGGPIPPNFSNPASLSDLWLNDNELIGPIPSPSEGQLQNIQEVLLYGNLLTGPVPEQFCELRDSLPLFDTLEADCGGPLPQNTCECCSICLLGQSSSGPEVDQGGEMDESEGDISNSTSAVHGYGIF